MVKKEMFQSKFINLNIKIIIIIILFLSEFPVKSQNKESIRNDSLSIKFLDSLRKFKIETSYYKSGKTKNEKTFYDNKVINIKQFSDFGFILADYNYNLNGEKIGYQTEYYQDGKIKKEESIINYSVVKRKHNNQLVTLKVKNGTYKEFYENGILKEEGGFLFGEKNGVFIEFDLNGKIKNIEYFDTRSKN